MQQQPTKGETRNLIIAGVLCFLVLIAWGPLFGPEPPPPGEETTPQTQSEPGAEAPAGFDQPLPHDLALEQSERIRISTPRLEGSIALTGGIVDELRLTNYDVELGGDEQIELLHPRLAANGYYARFGWRGDDATLRRPGLGDRWALAQGSADTLTPETPVTLVWPNESTEDRESIPFVYTITYAVDDRYMFTVEQKVRYADDAATRPPAFYRPFARVTRDGFQQVQGLWVLHEGPIGVVNGALVTYDYDDLDDAETIAGDWRGETERATQTSWIGYTDPYWLTAIAPVGEDAFETIFGRTPGVSNAPRYHVEAVAEAKLLQGEGEVVFTTNFFAGAKEISALRDYQYMLDDPDGSGPPDNFFGKVSDFFFYDSESRFVDAVDWGWFFFLTKPIFEILAGIYAVIGNMGVAIILLTLVFKTLLFPLAYKSYVSMSRMKKLQPEMKKIQERYKEDRQKMQQEMMALYRKEKVNPAAGCLPLIAQIPIFFSLYKVLIISIELRHAPFFGWIQDLSAPDPTSVLNLFGILPYDVPDLGFFNFLAIGIWPILMGVSMWLQQSLNPAPTDEMQAKIFAWLPVIFTFILGTFASGLVLYWTANNVLTIIQQYTIMRREGVEVNFIENVLRKLKIGQRKESG